MNLTDITAMASQILMEAAEADMPEPRTCTTSYFGDRASVSLQMSSFADVQAWADYMHVEYKYSETETFNYSTLQGTRVVGFANAQSELHTHYVGETEYPYTVDAYHNEPITTDTEQTALFEDTSDHYPSTEGT